MLHRLCFLSAESTELLQNVDVDEHNDLCIVNILDEWFGTLDVQYFDVSDSDSLQVHEVQYSGSYAEATSVPLRGVVPVGSILWSTTDVEGAHSGFEICRTAPCVPGTSSVSRSEFEHKVVYTEETSASSSTSALTSELAKQQLLVHSATSSLGNKFWDRLENPVPDLAATRLKIFSAHPFLLKSL